MPEANVRGVTLNYRTFGESGPWIAFTPGSRRAFAELAPLSERIAAEGYRVLLHDRRNCGASEVKIEDGGSEHEIWADDLHALCRHLGATSVYMGGSSAGARLAILFALRHPDALRGLLLWRVTGGQHAANRLAHQYYGAFMEIAKSGGMAAVCETEHFAACIKARPANRENLMRMNPDEFIRILDRWRKNFLAAADLPIVGATEAQLQSIKEPACIIAGNDKVHTPATARKAAALLPHSELHEDVVEKRSDDDLKDEWDQQEWRNAEGRIAQTFLAFLSKAEAARN
jgi:pimeloyl-ACP methyl ester carboxylesterase